MKKLLFLWYMALGAIAGAQVKVSELPALTGAEAASSDVLPIVDVSAGAEGSKKITLAELFSTPVPWHGVPITDSYVASAATWNAKEGPITAGTTGQYWRGDKTWRTLDKSAVGLGNVDNTADASKPVSTATQTALDGKLDASAATWIDVTDAPYNAVGDAQCRFDASVTSGSATVTIPSGSLPAIATPKYCRLEGAGTAGADLITTVIARPTATTFTLGTNALTTVSAKAIFWGTDDSTAINNAINAATSSTVTRTVYFPPLKYLANVTLKRNVKLLGAWRGSVIERIYTVSELEDRQLTGTVLFPATTAQPVIRGVDAVQTVFGGGVEGFVISGSTAKHGTGIHMGSNWGEDGFSSGALDIVRCQVSGFDTAIKHSNAVEGDIAFVHWNDCNTGVEIWKHDAITIRNCGSNNITGGNNFRIGSSKAVHISTGNYNNFARFVDATDSAVHIGSVNVEAPTAEVFAMRGNGGDGGRLIADYVKVLSSTTGILCRNYYPEAQKDDCYIDIRSTNGNTVYFDTANSNTPPKLPVTYIRRYTDNTFATLKQTESTARVYLTPEEKKTCPTLEESFASRYSASPYCDLGWVATTSGSWNTPGSSAYALNVNQLCPGGFRLSSASQSTANILRFDANTAVLMPGGASYWELRGWVQSDWPDTGIYRFGIYSQDATVKPQYGVGILSDATAYTNIQLEVITAGVSSVVDTGIPVSNANPALSTLKTFKEVILQYRPTLGLSVVIKDLNGATLAPEVFAGTVSAGWPSYHRIACYAGSNTNQWIDVNFGKVTFIRYRTSM